MVGIKANIFSIVLLARWTIHEQRKSLVKCNDSWKLCSFKGSFGQIKSLFKQNILSKNDAKKFWKVPVLFALFLYD